MSGGNALLYDCSRKGTFVNGYFFPLKTLVHGDRIQVGRAKFVYLQGDDLDSRLSTLIRRFKQERVEIARRSGPAEECAATDRTILAGFLQINTCINKLKDVDEIQAQIAELIFRVVPAERVALLLTGPDGKSFGSRFYRQLGSDSGEHFPIDEDHAIHVLRTGEDSIKHGEPFIVCRRMEAFDAAIGVIYVELNAPSRWTLLDFLDKLLHSIAALAAVALEHARYVKGLEGENRRLNEDLQIAHGMIGRSAKMQHMHYYISKGGPSDLPVLITGPSGSGKELVARAIHRESPRSNKPFIAVNCGAFTETLLESELFGHQKGAFTGANTGREGLFEAANEGTIFLDEIAELPMTLQAALLRVLQSGEIKRLGSNNITKVNVRIIAATNRDLKEWIRERRFREDLLFRLNVLAIEMPSLADRREDIPLLIAHFIQKHGYLRGNSAQPAVAGLAPKTREWMKYSWPGNIRELEHAIQHAISLGTSRYILPQDLPSHLNKQIAREAETLTYAEEKIRFQQALFAKTLMRTNGNVREAANLLGISEKYLYQRCKELAVNKPDS